jgi:hypothetical protein
MESDSIKQLVTLEAFHKNHSLSEEDIGCDYMNLRTLQIR